MTHDKHTSTQKPVPPSLVLEARGEVRTSGWIILLNFLFVVGIVVVALRWTDWHNFLSALRNINLFWIGIILILQAGTYACVAYAWHSVLRRFGRSIPIRGLLSLSLAKLFLDQAVPIFGLGGTAVAIRGFLRRGIAAHAAIAAAAVYMLTELIINILFILTAFLILSANRDLGPVFTIPTILMIFALGVITIPSILYAIRDTRVLRAVKNLEPIAWLIKMVSEIPRDTLADLGLWIEVSISLAMIWVLDGVTLWALLVALGVNASIFTILACSIISSVVANMIIVPGGLGIFEGSSIVLMSLFGIPLEHAIAASVLMRGFTYWLPMIPGFLIVRGEFLRPGNRSGRSRRHGPLGNGI